MVLVKGLIFYKASFKIKIVKQNVHQAGTYSVCLDPLNPRLRFTSCVFVPFFFFFLFTRFWVTRLLFMYRLLNSNRKCWLFYSKQCISVLFMDPQISLFSNFFIKNGSHGTIHTFKNYFATVFSVFSFQFQQNKLYSNRYITKIASGT